MVNNLVVRSKLYKNWSKVRQSSSISVKSLVTKVKIVQIGQKFGFFNVKIRQYQSKWPKMAKKWLEKKKKHNNNELMWPFVSGSKVNCWKCRAWCPHRNWTVRPGRAWARCPSSARRPLLALSWTRPPPWSSKP